MMEIPVLIEPVSGNGYQATSGGPLGAVAEGKTPEEALQNLREMIEGRMAAGARIVSLQVSSPKAPWAPFAGMLRGDPMLSAWKQAMAEYRRRMDEDPDVP